MSMTQEQLANANAFLMQEGGKAFQFENIGDTCIGEVLTVDMRQQTDVDTGERLTWNDGTPRMQLVITIQTDDHANDDDDGVRAIYAKGGKHDVASGEGMSMKDAIAKAVRDAKGDGVYPGDRLAVCFSGLGVKKNKAYSQPKLYVAGYEKAKPSGISGAALFGESSAEAE